MEKYKLGYYLDTYNTLLPSDLDLGSVASEDWYIAIKSQFDDLAWLYYYNKELIDCSRFDISEPLTVYNNIKKSIGIYLKQNNRRYNRIFNAFTANFNPLWNVDGVTGTVSENAKTGKDTYKKTGTTSDGHTGTISDNGSNVGTTVRTGSETLASTGTDTTSDAATTFDSGSSYLPTTQSALSHGKTDTTTYNNVTDTDNYTTGNTKTFANTDTTTHNTTDETLYNNKDQFVEMVIRQGNIGVTRSDELITHAIELFNSCLYDFYKMVVSDCINLVTYRIY